MKKSIFIGLLFSALILDSWSQTSIVYFEKNSFNLTDNAQFELDSLVQVIRKSKNRRELQIIGHTDSDASNNYNEKLALNRAIAVKDYLKSNQIKNRCHVITKGETQSINNNANESQKALNRRVEVHLNYVSDNSVYKDFDQKYQEFEISNQQDTIIKCKEGTELTIKAGSFDTKNKKDLIKIKVKEFYDKGSFIASNLTASTYDNKILESRGMLNVKASQKGKPLRLKEGQTIDILFRDREEGDNTQLFTGVRVNGEIMWKQASKPLKSESNMQNSSTSEAENNDSERIIVYDQRNGGRVVVSSQRGVGELRNLDTAFLYSEPKYIDNLISTTKLGWINCDRFYKNPSPKIDFVVSIPGGMDPDVTLVFEEINSVMPYSYREGNKYVFRNIPEGMKVKVIGLYKNKKQQDYYLAVESMVVQDGEIQVVPLRKGSKEDVKNVIAGL